MDNNNLRWPDAVFWDWDGTIVDSYAFLNDAHNHTLTSLGFPAFKDEEYKEYFGKPREVLYPAIYKDKADQAMDIFQNYVFENSHKVTTIADTQDVLELFHQRNITMGIVSNKKANFIAEELKHTGFEKYFQTIVGAGDAEADKPSSAPLNLAIERTKTHGKSIWFVGDTENDLACAKEANSPSLFLKGHADSPKLIKQYKPLFSFDNYSQLKEFLVAI
ncbi:MAG: HAD family hydrolase [Alphaproteobacteria bacterium]